MDCEKFDRVVLDLLYEELDELTSAAAKRHMDHCARCRGVGGRLRATREVAVLPLIEPPSDLAARILEAERGARAHLPLRQRMGRAISVIAGYAMRPQLAMAALLLLMIGSSLLLLRARPGGRETVQQVTERGVPDNAGESVAIVPLPEKLPQSDTPRFGQAHGALRDEAEPKRERKTDELAEAPHGKASAASPAPEAQTGAIVAASDAGTDPEFDSAMQALRGGRYADAQKRFDQVASEGGSNAATASFFAAQAARSGSGCSAAAPRFESVNTQNPGSSIGNEAAWQAADCWRVLGQLDRARRDYELLLAAPGYSERAREQLALLDKGQSGTAVAARSAAKAAKSKATSAPAAAAPAKPAPKVTDTANAF